MIFVAAVLIVLKAAGALVMVRPAPARMIGAYAIGTAAMLWLILRVAGLAA